MPVIIQDGVEMAFEEALPWHRFAVRLNMSDIPYLPQLLSAIPPEAVGRLRRGLGCVWPRMLWLERGLYTAAADTDAVIAEARGHDAFETLMWALRARLNGSGGKPSEAERWRAPTRSCAPWAANDDGFPLDIDAVRARVFAGGKPPLSADAAAVAEILDEWARRGGGGAGDSDWVFAMRTRYFPTGVKVVGKQWT